MFSAAIHEYCLAVILKAVRPILIGFMISQIPLFMMTKSMKGSFFGNMFFWAGIINGLPLILTLYLRIDYYLFD